MRSLLAGHTVKGCCEGEAGGGVSGGSAAAAAARREEADRKRKKLGASKHTRGAGAMAQAEVKKEEAAAAAADDAAQAKKTGPYEKVVVHPIVLLSVVDHYHRVAKDTKKRVVGMLLGSVSKGVVEITNCYAVPFEEDERDLKIWYLDHSYHEQMFAMFKKVNASEKLIGWYSTGPKIKPGDLQIDALVRRYCANPVMVIVDVKPKALGIPTEAYLAVEQIIEGQQQSWTFEHVPSEIGASESEEVGVEHLLRDVKDMTISTLANRACSPRLQRAPSPMNPSSSACRARVCRRHRPLSCSPPPVSLTPPIVSPRRIDPLTAPPSPPQTTTALPSRGVQA